MLGTCRASSNLPAKIIKLTKRHYPSTMLNSIIDLSERVEQGGWVVMVLEGEGGGEMAERGRWRTSQKQGLGEGVTFSLYFHN